MQMQCCSSAAHQLFLGRPLTIGTHGTRRQRSGGGGRIEIEMRDRSKNRKPTQRGRYLSSEAILAVQSLKRSFISSSNSNTNSNYKEKVQRLIKRDMVAVMRELLSQGEPLLALLVFEEIRNEHWYRPQLSMYLDIISVLARSNLTKELQHTCSLLKREYHLQADTETFNLLLQVLLEFDHLHLALDSFRLMRLWDCEPDQDTYTILIPKLQSLGEIDVSRSLRLEAKKRYGTSLDFLQEKQNMLQPSHELPSVL
ncbi:Pentatricopeptide repeat-containing protein [Rhynchospora pubera]|uniref:Pentatricopeptide repeat-containing protein n=1 Tax=Rhynchospora pubera TaxID=906938 RepID=A0AAV8GZ61_9POAL|nr:Pentatricopeptide repeat-containing protein [Rhynchospora pubera]